MFSFLFIAVVANLFVASLADPVNSEEATVNCMSGSLAQNAYVYIDFQKISGSLILRLKIKDVAEFEKLAGPSCFPARGQKVDWHVHLKQNISGAIGIGHAACANLGGHYDPGLACGPSSGNSLCKKLQIPPSSAFNNSSPTYSCTPENYLRKNSYSCEAGDFAGKYGELVVPPTRRNTMAFTVHVQDLNDGLNPCQLHDTSLVIHCGKTTKRALCVKLDVLPEKKDLFYLSLRKYREELIDYENAATDVLMSDSSN